jgi:macrodomain Ter protein organizer (MatP/YcbG family)
MNKKHNKEMEIEELAERAHYGEDVSRHFTGDHIVKQKIDIDLPLVFLRLIDEECKHMGITREAWIKMACNERLRKAGINRDLTKAS